MTTRKRKHRGCWPARLARARQARAAARKANAGRLLGWLLFVLGLLSIPVADLSAPPARTMGKRKPGAARPLVSNDDGASSPPSPYELGAPPSLRPRWSSQSGRYGGSRPTLARLVRDLRRPAAGREAGDMLMARIPVEDAELCDWVQEQLDDSSLTALVMWARPGLAETDVFASWSKAARRQAEEEAAALRETLTRTGGGGGDGSEGVSGGIWKP